MKRSGIYPSIRWPYLQCSVFGKIPIQNVFIFLLSHTVTPNFTAEKFLSCIVNTGHRCEILGFQNSE